MFHEILAKSADPDQTAPQEKSDMGLHRLAVALLSENNNDFGNC